MAPPKVAVLVCTYNGIENGIEKCLTSLLNLNYPQDRLEVIAVDDGSTDKTGECISDFKIPFSRQGTTLKHIVNNPNIGLYGSKKKGVDETSPESELVLVTDDDCEVDSGWASGLVQPYEHPEVGSVGGFINSKRANTLLERFAIFSGNNVLSNPENARFFHGANCSYRKSALLKAGNFNSGTTSGGDAEISFKLRKVGFKLFYQPSAIVYHQHRTSLKGLWRQFKKYGGGDFELLEQFWDARFTPDEMGTLFLNSLKQIPGRLITSPFKR